MRHGQAALEYLVTYGWGFVAVLVVISGMAYFGYLEPAKYLPARCDFGAQLQCIDHRLEPAIDGTNNGCILLQVQNNFGDAIRIYGIETAGGTGNLLSYPDEASVDCADSSGLGAGSFVLVEKGNVSRILRVFIETTDTEVYLANEDRQSVQLIVDFSRDLDGAPRHNVTGEVFATAVS